MKDFIEKLYQVRFPKGLEQKNKVWKALCHSFYQQYISNKDAVLDIGAGYCEFINNIHCNKKYALDLNKDISKYANSDVETFVHSSTSLPFDKESIDIIFISNFLEHLKDKKEITDTLSEAYRILKPNGKVLITQPNIRYTKEYWNFFDHNIPLTEKCLIEVLEIIGFKIEKVLSRFLPLTMKSKIPQNTLLVKLYLRFPFFWKIMGQQSFIIAKK